MNGIKKTQRIPLRYFYYKTYSASLAFLVDI